MSNNDSPETLSQALIDSIRKKGELTDPDVELALRAIPRHLFLPQVSPPDVYVDMAVPVKHDEQGMVISSSSQPTMMILMLSQLRLSAGHNVLEIGAGTGYNAAIMNHIVGETGFVTSIELDNDLAKQAQKNLHRAGVGGVNIVQRDGAMGYAPRAAYDRIISTVAVWDIPPAWENQLKSTGILVTPIWLDGIQVSASFRLQPDGTLYSEHVIPCAFVSLRGDDAGPPMRRRLSSTAMYVSADEVEKIDSAALHLLMSDDQEIVSLGSTITSTDFWYGFQPYLMLHEPAGYIFAVYLLLGDQQIYGIADNGLLLFSQGSVCLVPYTEQGDVHCFGSADAYITLQESVTAWENAGRPGMKQMRLRLIPTRHGKPAINNGKLYRRRNHFMHVWLDLSG